MSTVRTQNDNDPFKMWLSSFSLIPLSLPMSLVFVDLETNNEKKNRQPTIWKMVCFALCRVLFAESSVSAQCSNAVVDVVNAIVLEHHFIIIIGIGDKSRWWNNFQFLKLEQPNEDQWITRSALFSAVRALHWKGNCFVNISRENRRKKKHGGRMQHSLKILLPTETCSLSKIPFASAANSSAIAVFT